MTKNPSHIDLDSLRLVYTGSVQHLFAMEQWPQFLLSETTEGGSVFDVGTIFSIPGSDVARTCFRHQIYQLLANASAWCKLRDTLSTSEQSDLLNSSWISECLATLCSDGATTHHRGIVSSDGQVFTKGFPQHPGNLTLVQRFAVHKPVLRSNHWGHWYDYNNLVHADDYVIPLEYIVRLGLTKSSSILKNWSGLPQQQQTDFLRQSAMCEPLDAWQRFAQPVVDCTSKYEPEDRILSLQESASIATIPGDMFAQSLALVTLATCLVEQALQHTGLTLWDMKWELARSGNTLILVDTVDTDSMRLTTQCKRDNQQYHIHFSKQAMRDYYTIMATDWIAAIKDAKTQATSSDQPFTQILAQGQKTGNYPPTPVVDADFMAIQQSKLALIQTAMIDADGQYNEQVSGLANLEVDYYLQSKHHHNFALLQ